MAPRKIKDVIGAVKDQTSISLAKVACCSSLSGLEVAVVKATRHGQNPPNQCYVAEILSLTSYSHAMVNSCASNCIAWNETIESTVSTQNSNLSGDSLTHGIGVVPLMVKTSPTTSLGVVVEQEVERSVPLPILQASTVMSYPASSSPFMQTYVDSHQESTNYMQQAPPPSYTSSLSPPHCRKILLGVASTITYHAVLVARRMWTASRSR